MKKLKLNIQLFGGSLSITASETDVSIENNQSYINLTIKATTNSTTYNDSAYLKSASIVGQNNTYSLGRINFSIGKGKTVTVYSGRIGPFDHNADGSLNNVSISASCYIVSNTQPTASASVPMSTIPRASSFTVSGGTIGQTLTVNINRASSDFTHEVRVYYGSKTQVISLNAGTSASATLDMDFCNQIPSATTAQAIVQVITKNGSSYVGDNVNQLHTITVPNNVVPSISSVTKSDTANLVGTYGAYVQGKSNLRIQTSANGSYSSWITNVTVNIKDSNYNLLRQLTGDDVTLSNISYVGTLNIEVIVTDSRGRQSTNTSQISVVEYFNPKINYFTAERRNNDSTITFTWSGESCNINNNNVNGHTFRLYKRQKGQSNYSLVTDYNGAYSWSRNDYTTTCDENYGWEFAFQVEDSFMYNNYYAEVGTAFELMNWGADGTSMAIGKVSEKSNTFEVDLTTEINNVATINTPDNTYGGVIINSGNTNEASIRYRSNDQSKEYVVGYGTARFDGFGIWSNENGNNVFTIDKYGNTTIQGLLMTPTHKQYYLGSSGDNNYPSYYLLARFPVDNAANHSVLRINGSLGGWSSENKIIVDFSITNRDGLKVDGNFYGDNRAFGKFDFELYNYNNDIYVYLHRVEQYVSEVILDIMVEEVEWYGETTTSSPSGTLVKTINEKTLNNNNVYSTNEIKVGTYVDGKPIYRIVLETTGNNSNYQDIGYIADLDNVIRVDCWAKNGPTRRNITCSDYFGDVQWASQIYIDWGYLKIECGNYFLSFKNGATIKAIVEYTKTTD